MTKSGMTKTSSGLARLYYLIFYPADALPTCSMLLSENITKALHHDFSALTLLIEQHEGHPACKILSGEVVIRLRQGADLHMAKQMPLPLTVSCSRKSRLLLVLPFWYRLTRVVPDKIQRAVKL